METNLRTSYPHIFVHIYILIIYPLTLHKHIYWKFPFAHHSTWRKTFSPVPEFNKLIIMNWQKKRRIKVLIRLNLAQLHHSMRCSYIAHYPEAHLGVFHFSLCFNIMLALSRVFGASPVSPCGVYILRRGAKKLIFYGKVYSFFIQCDKKYFFFRLYVARLQPLYVVHYAHRSCELLCVWYCTLYRIYTFSGFTLSCNFFSDIKKNRE